MYKFTLAMCQPGLSFHHVWFHYIAATGRCISSWQTLWIQRALDRQRSASRPIHSFPLMHCRQFYYKSQQEHFQAFCWRACLYEAAPTCRASDSKTLKHCEIESGTAALFHRLHPLAFPRRATAPECGLHYNDNNIVSWLSVISISVREISSMH